MKAKNVFSALLLWGMTGLIGSGNVQAEGKIKIVATTTVIGSIAGEIAGTEAEIYSIAKPKRDPHFYSPTPRDVLKAKKADVLIHGGLDLETWRGPLLDAVGKPELMWPNGKRQIDVSAGIELLEIPPSLSRAEGDIHAYGNPHYWIDPENGKRVARNIAEGLARLYPEEADFFLKNAGIFEAKMDIKIKKWTALLAPYAGKKIISYHKSMIYFLRRFGLVSAGEIEPKPGIPPTARHLATLKKIMKEDQIKVILKETFHENSTPKKVANDTGALIVIFAQAVGEVPEAGDYRSMMDYDVRAVEAAFSPVFPSIRRIDEKTALDA
ncbi:MAG: hypothetical protein A2Z83_09320 [Omnitrophica bacterium GWA2_52_8]|nr:MAG: hypothetical protein A2Z83_09320 [Omnitrophica bacterium GWA2_52_8]